MLTRYLITIGATTTAGGTVTSGSAMNTIDGIGIALEGDPVWCPACQSEGVIALDGPRLSSTFDGREEALDDDLCLCKCSPPPRLVACQGFESQEIDTDWHAQRSDSVADAAALLNGGAGRATPDDAVPLLLLDPGTQAPLRHRPYRLQLREGGAIEGTTDAEGATRPLSVAERASVLAWQRDGQDSPA